jgi:hypothetical protein
MVTRASIRPQLGPTNFTGHLWIDYFLVKNQQLSQVEMVYNILLAKQYSSLKTEKCDKTAHLFRDSFFSLLFIFLGLFLFVRP